MRATHAVIMRVKLFIARLARRGALVQFAAAWACLAVFPRLPLSAATDVQPPILSDFFACQCPAWGRHYGVKRTVTSDVAAEVGNETIEQTGINPRAAP